MNVTLTGRITDILDEETRGNFTWRNLRMMIDEEANAQGKSYPQAMEVQFTKDKMAELDRYNIGEKVTIEANLSGRESNGRVWISLRGWAIKTLTAVTSHLPRAASSVARTQAAQAPEQTSNDLIDDGMPF